MFIKICWIYIYTVDDSLLLINIPLFILKLLFNIHVCDASDIHNKHKDNNIFESILILLLFELIIVLLFWIKFVEYNDIIPQYELIIDEPDDEIKLLLINFKCELIKLFVKSE